MITSHLKSQKNVSDVSGNPKNLETAYSTRTMVTGRRAQSIAT